MAYTKNTWADGDIVTSEKLNHMEDGIANADNVFIVKGATLNENGEFEGTFDKTWQEIHDAMLSKICIVVITDDNGITQVLINGAGVSPASGDYVVSFGGGTASGFFSTKAANGYPAYSGVN